MGRWSSGARRPATDRARRGGTARSSWTAPTGSRCSPRTAGAECGPRTGRRRTRGRARCRVPSNHPRTTNEPRAARTRTRSCRGCSRRRTSSACARAPRRCRGESASTRSSCGCGRPARASATRCTWRDRPPRRRDQEVRTATQARSRDAVEGRSPWVDALCPAVEDQVLDARRPAPLRGRGHRVDPRPDLAARHGRHSRCRTPLVDHLVAERRNHLGPLARRRRPRRRRGRPTRGDGHPAANDHPGTATHDRHLRSVPSGPNADRHPSVGGIGHASANCPEH